MRSLYTSALCAALLGTSAQIASAQSTPQACHDEFKRQAARKCVLIAGDTPLSPSPRGADSCFVILVAKDREEAKAKRAALSFPDFTIDAQVSVGTGACSGVFFVAAQKTQVSAAATPAPAPAAAPAPDPDPATTAAAEPAAESPEALLKAVALEQLFARYEARSSATGRSMSAAVLPALVQVLGQVVLERGSHAALGLARQRLLDALHCDPAEPPTGGAPSLPRTCDLIRATSLADLPGVGKLLKRAVLADVTAIALKAKHDAVPSPQAQALVSFAIERVVLATLAQGSAPDARTLDAIHSEIITVAKGFASKITPGMALPTDARDTALVAFTIAVSALAACEITQGGELDQCDLERNVRAVVEKLGASAEWAALRQLALRFSGLLFTARYTAQDGDASEPRKRLHAAVDSVLELACSAAGGCEEPAEIAEGATLAAGAYLARLRPLAHAAIDDDGAATLHAGLRFVSSAAQASTQRSARMLVRVILVGEAFASAKDTEDKSSFEARKELIEALADDFADRAGRGGDTVFALGGSLRLLLGKRYLQEDQGEALMGPLGLTLGMSITHLPQDPDAPGFFAELAVVDLGQYLAFEDGTELKEPNLDDALSPWLTVGLAWGVQNPFFVALSAGYSPTHRAPDSDEVVSSFNLGLTAGVHVPLLDLN